MLKTPICDLLGIEHPVLQGGMAWVSDGKLAGAVSEAGGLGIISAMRSDAAQVAHEIEVARSITEKPIGVNVMLMSPHVEKLADLLVEKKVEVVTTGAGNPAKYMSAWNDAGIKVVPVVASVALARLAERAGATAIIAEGGESGGHVGELTTMTLVPLVSDAVSIPVIAAGGIGDGRGMAAAFMLGATGVQMGTRFLVAHECTIHQTYKDKVRKANDLSTITTGKRTGHPIRSLKTPFTRELAKAELEGSIADEELSKAGIGALRRAAREGDEKQGFFMAGQISALVRSEQSAREIIEDVVRGAEDVLKTAQRWVT